jgi:hypothetical protein
MTTKYREYGFYLLTLVFAVLIFIPQAYRWCFDADFWLHGELVEKFMTNSTDFFTNTPHFVFHVSSALLVPLTQHTAGAMAILIVLVQLVSTAVVYMGLRSVLPKENLSWGFGLVLVILTLTLMLVSAINIFTPENLYLGYFTAHVYHNPTQNMMKPFALMLFFMSLKCFEADFKIKRLWLWVLGYALVTLLSLFSKPSFVIMFVPALGVLTGLRILMRQPIRWGLLMLGIVIPTFIALYIQTRTWTQSNGLAIMPFETFFHWTLHYDKNANQDLLFKLLMSIAFPLTVTVLFIREAVRSRIMWLAWIAFIIGIGYSYLLIDLSAPQTGDWTWSGQIATLTLFVANGVFMLQQSKNSSNSVKVLILVCVLVLGIHLLSGMHWYLKHLTAIYQDLLFYWW